MSIRNMMIGGAGARVPDAPTGVSASNATATTLDVSFSAPANNGGSAITGYTVTSSPGGITATGSSSPITVSGLTALTSYTFTVTATNAIGTSAASDPSSAVSTGANELYSFSSVTFTGASYGREAPSLSAIKSRMSGASSGGAWTNNGSYLNSSSGRILWTVPKTGTYSFTLAGARGGANQTNTQEGGYGAIGTRSVSLTQGDVLEMIAGHGGTGNGNGMSYGSQAAGGGGGASYVASNGSTTAIAVAGGGGGGSQNQTGVTFTSWSSGSASLAAPHVNNGSTNGGIGSYTQDVNGTHEGGAGGGWAQRGQTQSGYTAQPERRHGRALASAYGTALGGINGTEDDSGGQGGFGSGGGGGIGNGAGGGGGGHYGGWGGVYSDPGIGTNSSRTGGQSGSGGDSFNISSFTGWNSGPAGYITITFVS